MRLVYDFETNGLFLDDLRPGTKDASAITKVHCLVTQDVDMGEVRAYYQDPFDKTLPWHGTLQDGVRELLEADVRYAHNGLTYDERVIRTFFPELWTARRKGTTFLDSMVGGACVWPTEHLRRLDAARIARARLQNKPPFPPQLIGRHSLEAWGRRLGNRKAGYEGGWEKFTPAMLSYCVQDVSTLRTLVQKLDAKIAAGHFTVRAWELEQDFKLEIAKQMANGFAFDVPAAEKLAATWQIERAALVTKLAQDVPPFENHYLTEVKKIPKVKVVPYNPGSRHHVARDLMERHGWKPDPGTGYTPTGDVKIDETVLDGIAHLPNVPTIQRYLLLQKRLSQVAEKQNKNAKPWLDCVQADGRIHGRVDHCAAVSSRVTHSSPNMSAVPKPGSDFGMECRALFTAGPGMVLVDGDVKALEPRLLGHYLWPTDGGAFATRVMEGTLYEKVVELLKIPAGPLQRDIGKRTFLAWIYGAGGAKLGKILGRSEGQGKAAGAALRRGLQVGALQERLRGIAKRLGTINLLDGRRAHVRSEHSVLNTLLQGSGSVFVKQAVVLLHGRLRREGVEARQVGYFHDEVVLECAPADAPTVAKAVEWAVEQAGIDFGLRIPMRADVKIGKNWSLVH